MLKFETKDLPSSSLKDIERALAASPKLKTRGKIELEIRKTDGIPRYEIDGGKLIFHHSKFGSRNTKIIGTYFIIADYILQQASNGQQWKKHWKPNKREVRRLIAENKAAFSPLRDIIGQKQIDVLGFAVVLLVYVQYAKGKYEDEGKTFKNTFLNFFKRDTSDEISAQTNDEKLIHLQSSTRIIQQYNDLPEKGVSTNLDSYLPDGLKTRSVDFLKEKTTIAEAIDFLESEIDEKSGVKREQQILAFTSTVEKELTETFMKEVLGKPEEKVVDGETVKIKPASFEAQKWQKEQREMLDSFADVFKVETGSVIINDLQSTLDNQNPKDFEMVSKLDKKQKDIWKDLIEKTNSTDIDFSELFKPFELEIEDGKVKSSGFTWYTAANNKLEDFRVLVQRAKESGETGYDDMELEAALEQVVEMLQPPIPDPETPVVTIGPIKGADRAIQKIAKYDQDISRLGDIVRFTIVVDKDLSNFEEIFETLRQQVEMQGGEIATRIENRYEEPTPVAYGDVTFSVRYKSGLVGEVQITTPVMAAAKERLHKEYEKQRNVDSYTEYLKGMAKSVEDIMLLEDKRQAGDLASNLKKTIAEIQSKLIDDAKPKHKEQMESEFNKVIAPIQEAIAKLESGAMSVAQVASLVSKTAKFFPSIKDLYEYEQTQLNQIQGYIEARTAMGMPDFIQPFPLRTTMKGGEIVFKDDFLEHIMENVEQNLDVGSENNPTQEYLESAAKQILLARSYDKDTYGYPASYTKQVQKALQKKSSSLHTKVAADIGVDGSGYYMIEGIPYSWDGFMTLPKFFTGNDPAGEVDAELADFLRKATPITEDAFHKAVAELTMEKAQKREEMLELGEAMIQAYRQAKATGEIKTASTKTAKEKVLRNKLIRLAHTKPHLRKHILPLLKNATNSSELLKAKTISIKGYGMFTVVGADVKKQDIYLKEMGGRKEYTLSVTLGASLEGNGAELKARGNTRMRPRFIDGKLITII